MVSSFRLVVLPAAAVATECGLASDPASCLSSSSCAWLMLQGRCEGSDSAEALASPPSCCSSTAPNTICAYSTAELSHAMCELPPANRSLAAPGESFDRTYATRMAHLSGAAYCSEAVVTSWTCGEHCTSVPGLEMIHYVKKEDQVLAGFVAWDPSIGAIVVSFRGTIMQSITNWLGNIKFLKTYPFAQHPDVGVHRGFWESWQYLATDVLAAIQTIQQSHAGANVVVTGHSLGGAIATDAALDLSLNHGLTTSVVNFGSPRAGDWQFSSLLKQRVPSFWRVTHAQDLVPHVPMQQWGFWHAATEVYFNEPQTEYRVCDDSGEDFSCSRQCAWSLACTSVSDHVTYYGVQGDCASSDEEESTEESEYPAEEPTAAPVDPTPQDPTGMPFVPTTAPMHPTLAPENCKTCLTFCASCKACTEGPESMFAFGSCEKCWHCWNWDDDELEDDDDSMNTECDALHKDHDWDDDEVRCLTNDHKDCRACWAEVGEASMFV